MDLVFKARKEHLLDPLLLLASEILQENNGTGY